MKTQKRILSLIMSMVMVISTFVGYAANIKYVKAEAADTMDITWHFQNASEWELVGGWLYEGNAFTTNVSPADKCIVKTLETLEDEETGETYENVKQVWPGAAMDNEGGSNSSWYKVTATYTDPSASGVVSIFNNYAADNWTNDTTTQADLDNIKANAVDGKIKVNTIADDAADEVKDYWADVPSSCFATKEQTANIVISARAIKSVDGTITDIYCTNDGTTVTCYAKTDSGKLYQIAGNRANEVESVPDYNEGGEDETTEDETSTSDETTEEETTEEETTEQQKNPNSISENLEEGEVVYSLGSAMAPVAWNPDHVDNAFVETKWDNVVKANISVPAKYTGKVTTNEDGTNKYEEVGEWEYRFGIIAQTTETVTGWNRMLLGTDVAPEVTDTTSNCLSNIRVPLEEEAYTATVYLDTATGAVVIYKNGDNESVSYPTDKVDYTFSWVGNDNDETYYAPADYAQFATVGDYEATLSAAADRTADLEKCGYTADSALPNFVDVNNALEAKLNNVADAVSGTDDTIYTLGSAMAPVAWQPQNLNNAFEETKWDGVVKANISVPAEGAGEWEYRFGIIATTDNTVNAWNRALVGTTVAPETTDTTSNCLTNIRPALEEEAYEAVVYYDTTTGAVAIYKTGDDSDDVTSTPGGLVDITMSWVGNDNDETYYAPADYANFATVGDYEDTLNAKADRTADLEKCGYTSESALPDFAALNADLNKKLTSVNVADVVAGTDDTVYTLGSAMAPVEWAPTDYANAFEETKWDGVVKANITVPAATDEGGNPAGEWTYRFGIIATTDNTVNAWNRALVGTTVAPETTDTTSNCLTNIRPALEADAYKAVVYYDTTTGAVAIYKVGDDTEDLDSTPSDLVDITMSWVGNDNDETYYAPDEYTQFATVGDYEATLNAKDDRTADLEKCGYTAESALPDFATLNADLNEKLTTVKSAQDVAYEENTTVYTIGAAMAKTPWEPTSMNNAFEETKWDGVVKATISVPAATDEGGNPAGEWTYRFGIVAHTPDTVNAWNRVLVGTSVSPEVTDTTSNCLTNIRPQLEDEAYTATVYYDTTTGAVLIFKTDDAEGVLGLPDNLVDYTMSWVGNDNDETYYAPADYTQFATVGDYEATLNAKEDRTADLDTCGYTSDMQLPDFTKANLVLAEKILGNFKITTDKDSLTLEVGGMGTIEAKIEPEILADTGITVTVEGESATYDEETCAVRPVKSGDTTITFTNSYDPTISATVKVHVKDAADVAEETGKTVYTLGSAMSKVGWAPQDMNNAFEATDVEGVVKANISVPAEGANEWDYRFGIIATTVDTVNAWNRVLVGTTVAPETTDTTTCCLSNVRPVLEEEAYEAVVYYDTTTGAVAIYKADDEDFANPLDYTLSWVGNDNDETYYAPADYAQFATVGDYEDTLNAKEDRTADLEKCGYTADSAMPDFVGIKKALEIKLGGISDLSVQYKVQVQKTGWEKEYVADGTTSGTVGQALRLEAIKIKLVNSDGTAFDTANGGIEYRVHVQKNGWEKEYLANDELSGTVGEAKRLEAIQIRLTGKVADYYDVAYRVQAQKFGWLGWAMNDEESGTAGYAYRLEGIQIILVKKGEEIPSNVGGVADTGRDAFYGKSELPVVMYRTQVQTYGWQDYVKTGATSGTVGKAKRLEAIRIKISNNRGVSGDIEYRTHVQKKGWQKFVKNDALSGTVGKALRLEAIQIRFTGDLAEKFDIYYRVQAQKFGWMGWAKNGESAGTSGYGYRLEAIQIEVAKKGTPSGVIGTTKNAYRKK